MLDTLRRPFFIAALVLLILTVLIELGSAGLKQFNLPTPGLGVNYLALLDGLLLFSIALMSMSLLLPERVHGRVQGIVTFVFSLLMLLGAITLIFIAVQLLTLMVALFMAFPFGTAIYGAVYPPKFSLGEARAVLGTLMSLKLAFVVLLLLAHQRFIQNKGLVMIILTSLLANVILSFLHGIVPFFLVSITDAIGAIVVGILAAIWALVFLIGSIPAIIKALRIDRATA
jgi:hypothetical protein